jgi:hypothetical protein
MRDGLSSIRDIVLTIEYENITVASTPMMGEYPMSTADPSTPQLSWKGSNKLRPITIVALVADPPSTRSLGAVRYGARLAVASVIALGAHQNSMAKGVPE